MERTHQVEMTSSHAAEWRLQEQSCPVRHQSQHLSFSCMLGAYPYTSMSSPDKVNYVRRLVDVFVIRCQPHIRH